MKQIRLTSLTLTNYRNIEYASYQFDGSAKIVGENRIGKTNTLEAIMWLLTDKLLGGSNDIASLKPLSDTKREVIAKATFVVDEKEIISIKKEFKEKWVKTRGTTELIMQGHTTTYYFNDTKQGTYKDFYNNVCEAFGITYNGKAKVEIERLLVDPFYLGELGESKDWTNLRSLIIELVGDVNDDDVFNAKPQLVGIKDLLTSTRGKVDEAKKKIQQEINGLKDQVLGLESNIKFAEQTERPTDDELAIAQKGIDEHQTNIARLRANNGVDEISNNIQKEIVDIKDKLLKEKEKALSTINNDPSKLKRQELQDKINSLIDERTNQAKQLSTLELKIKNVKDDIDFYTQTRTDLINQLKKIDSDILNAVNGVETKCPLCGREYDEATKQEHIAKVKAELESKKQELIYKGKQNNLDKETALAELRKHEAEFQQVEQSDMAIVKEIDDLRKQIDEINNEPTRVVWEKSKEQQELETLLEQKEAELKKSQQDYLLGRQDINSQIYNEQELMKPYEKTLADMHYYERKQDEIKSLSEQLSDTNKKLADHEQDKELLVDFIKTKLEMLDSNVKKVFGNIKFQLIQPNINGGYDVVCKPYIYNVDKDESTNVLWKSGSKSERVITGVAILEAIKRTLDLPNLPILFDEGGEISTDTFDTRFKTNSQLICVKVQDGIKVPTVVALN